MADPHTLRRTLLGPGATEEFLRRYPHLALQFGAVPNKAEKPAGRPR